MSKIFDEFTDLPLSYTQKAYKRRIRDNKCGCGNELDGLTTCKECREKYQPRRVLSGDHVWRSMLSRCYEKNNVSYKYYGARGITVCKRWRDSFKNFIADMGPRPTLEHTINRKDNDKNYTPSNCEWSTYLEQSRNTRRVTRISMNGTTKTMSEWAAEYGINAHTLRHRIKVQGLTLEHALSKEIRGRTLKESV